MDRGAASTEDRERIGRSPTRVLLEETSGSGGTKLEEGGVRKKKGEKREKGEKGKEGHGEGFDSHGVG